MQAEMERSFQRAQRYKQNLNKGMYYSVFGKISMEPSSFRRHHFLAAHRAYFSTEWTPHIRADKIPPLASQPPIIYERSCGMLPHYTGHIPGYQYRFGQTFGNDTRDAKVWLTLLKPH